MRSSGVAARALSSPSSSSDSSVAPPRRPKKRARRDVSATAVARGSGSNGLWRESRGANGQVVLSLESDDDDDNDEPNDEDDESESSGSDQDVELRPTPPVKRRAPRPRPPAVVTPRGRETAPPVVYSVDSDSDSSVEASGDDAEEDDDDDDDDVEIVEQVSPAEDGGVVSSGNGSHKANDVDDEAEEEEEEEDNAEEDDDDDEEEEEWQPGEETEATHDSEELHDEDDNDEVDSADGHEDDGDRHVDPQPSPSTTVRPTVPKESGTATVRIKDEVTTPVKAEPEAEPPVAPLLPRRAVSVPQSPPPVSKQVEPVPIKSETSEDEPIGPLVSFSQIEHEAPPARTRHHHRHPRAARRSTVRRRRLDPDHAGMLLFDGPQYAPSAGVVKTLIEFIARSVGPMTGHERRWVDYVLLAKINTSVSSLSAEVFSRHSEWMKITLGASEESGGQTTHHIQREPLMALPIRYTVRPTHVIMPKQASNGKAKAKNAAAEKQQRAVDDKFLEKRAAELQSGDKRVKSETPRRRVSVGTPRNNGPFSPTSSTTSSSVSSRAIRAQRGDPPTPEHKRQRVAVTSPVGSGMYPPSTASTATATSPWPSADLVDLADSESTTGRNRSMPNDWDPEEVRAAPPSMRPASMNPLYTMPLGELKAHINSVRRDGRARSFEKPLEILQKLMNHPRNRETFNSPVDPVALNLPTYLDVIKEPMDLGTIRIRLEEAAYVEQDDFAADVRLVFENAMKFNAPNHSVHVDASVLLKLFEDLLRGGARDRQIKRRAQPHSSDRHACRVCLGRSCVMCDQGCLEFAQPHLQCAGSCGVDIRKGSIYYITRDGTRVWCAKCRTRHVKTPSDLAGGANEADGTQQEERTNGAKTKKKKPRRTAPAGLKEGEAGIDTVEIPGELIKTKCEVDVEPWVKCGRCFRWLHQVCGLYNPVYGAYGPESEYQCPLCVWKLRAPIPPLSASSKGNVVSILNDANDLPEQQHESSCSQIPTCELSVFIEEFLRRGLREMREDQAAEELHVRVLAFPHERVVVSDRLVKSLDDNAMVLDHLCADGPPLRPPPHRFPSEIAYTSRGIYLFQRLEGVDVALFTLFVQEFGDDCQLEANRRSVYVAYLDSIRYLSPPSARTASYHLIMMAYFDYIRRHGFERVHIWSCPPQKRISYVFWCRPAFQKTPSAEHLRAWYRRLLTKSKDAGIVQSWTTMYDEYFSPASISSAKAFNGSGAATGRETMTGSPGNSTVATRGTAARSVDPAEHTWPTAQLPPLFDGDFLPAELERILGRLAARNGKYRRGSGGGSGKSSAVGSTGGKLAVGEFVARIKEEKTASSAPAQVEFKAREIFDRCAHAVQRLKNDLLVVDLVVASSTTTTVTPTTLAQPSVPTWWHRAPRLFSSRFMFHQLCSSATYQFDTLRRAKHSTMMLFHHFVNEPVRQLNVFCSECFFLITHAAFWHCRSCARFALCDMCHHRDGRSHAHVLVFGSGFAVSAATAAPTLDASASASSGEQRDT